MMKSLIKKKVIGLKPSATLAINERCKELIAHGKKIYRFGFGQSPFPVPDNIVEEFSDHNHPFNVSKKINELKDIIYSKDKE